MKRRFLTLVLTLSLLTALSAPALAWEYPPRKYRTFQEYLEFYRSQEDEDTRALAAYIDARLTEGWVESFDADAWFEENLASPGMGISKGNWLAQNDYWHDAAGIYDQEWFRAEMLNTYLTESYRAWRDGEDARHQAELLQTTVERYPDLYAAFDPYAWFQGYYGASGSVAETYMYNWCLDEEGFKQKMFLEWVTKTPQNFFNGYCVTVNGVPISFQFYRDMDGEVVTPKAENERILVPLRAAAEALGLAVEWRPETDQVTCAKDGTTVTFTLDSTQYSGGTLDAAPFAENGVTYLPLRALGEALGCGVTWYQDFATAALTTEN